MQHSEESHSLEQSVNLQKEPSSPLNDHERLIQEMATRIIASPTPYPHLSTNPLSGNSLY